MLLNSIQISGVSFGEVYLEIHQEEQVSVQLVSPVSHLQTESPNPFPKKAEISSAKKGKNYLLLGYVCSE